MGCHLHKTVVTVDGCQPYRAAIGLSIAEAPVWYSVY